MSLDHFRTSNNEKIPWCLGAIRSMDTHLATHKLDSRTYQYLELNSLPTKLDCVHEESDCPFLENHRIVPKLGSLIDESVKNDALQRGEMRTVVCLPWMYGWTMPSWTGDIRPPLLVTAEECEGREVLEALFAAGDDRADVPSWGLTGTSFCLPQYQRPPCALPISSDWSTSTVGPTVRGPAPVQPSSETNRSSVSPGSWKTAVTAATATATAAINRKPHSRRCLPRQAEENMANVDLLDVSGESLDTAVKSNNTGNKIAARGKYAQQHYNKPSDTGNKITEAQFNEWMAVSLDFPGAQQNQNKPSDAGNKITEA
ncbi:hypothetical protein CkaCkLH20_01992 [Colletotrichum karsti]|uniref:Uncharacterized protein n=1 Tax=Colletotrichum karsti TaxID=1095194 RepID=A0A9P6LPJ2_9PEZI|nr:uncharacterized protein CkaCkLH20_01992 [Colletotrichum karsti]KAF9880950.1 hypothetical protein CkaCkLH20_01992 [Colletotrichum karsti]